MLVEKGMGRQDMQREQITHKIWSAFGEQAQVPADHGEEMIGVLGIGVLGITLLRKDLGCRKEGAMPSYGKENGLASIYDIISWLDPIYTAKMLE